MEQTLNKQKIFFETVFSKANVESAEDNKDFLIQGVAIHETVSRNNNEYKAEELEKSVDSLVGVPLLKDHDNSVDSVVGSVKEAWIEEDGIKFRANVVDDSVQKKIESGLLKNVSVGWIADKVTRKTKESKTIFEVKGLEFVELSLVAIPGVKGATFDKVIQEKFDIEDNNKMENEKLDALQAQIEKLTAQLAGKEESEPEGEPEKKPEAEPEKEPEKESESKEEEEKIKNLNAEIKELKSNLLTLTKEVVKSRAHKSEKVETQPAWLKGEIIKENNIMYQNWNPEYWRNHPYR